MVSSFVDLARAAENSGDSALTAEVNKLGYHLPGLIVIGEIVTVRNQLLGLVAEAGR